MPVYPVTNFLQKVDGVDTVMAADVNDLGDAITGIMTRLGTAANNAANGLVILDADSKIPVSQLGVRDAAAYTYVSDEVKGPVPCDGFVTAWFEVTSTGLVKAYIGATSSPADEVARAAYPNSSAGTILFVVKKGYYFKATNTGTMAGQYLWTPLGS